MNITRFLNQTATYTTPGLNDGYGGKVGGTSSTVNCRWVDEHDLIKDIGQQEVLSKAIVITENLLSIGGSLDLIGGIDDQEGIIKAVASIPSVDGNTKLNKAWIV